MSNIGTKAVIPTSTSLDSPEKYEDTHVHTVYDKIAHHFSSTRYKPWPVVAEFLASIPAGYIGLDAGCGNGKYLIAPRERDGKYWTIGLDRSARLLEVAKRAGDRDRDCVLGDVLETPWRAGAFDFAISIATIHHLSTPDRRKRSIQSLLKCLSPSHGRGLIYVWAIQQDDLSKRSVPTPVENMETRSNGQDVFVPWVLTGASASQTSDKTSRKKSPESTHGDTKQSSKAKAANSVFNRYYHMFDEGELRELIIAAATEMGISVAPIGAENAPLATHNTSRKRYIDITRDDWERSNYYVEFRLHRR